MKKLSHIIEFSIITIAALILSILTYRANGSAIFFNIDPSWQYGLNFFFNHHLQFGSRVNFTYGPFGFLLFSLPLGKNLLIASWFWFISRFFLAFSLIYLILVIHRKCNLSDFLITMAGVILFFYIANVHLLFFLGLCLIFLFNLEKNQIAYLLCASFLAVVIFLVKPSLGLYNFLALYTYLIIFSLNLNTCKYILIISISSILFYFSIWFAYYHNLSGSILFLQASWEFATGFNQAMAIIKANSLTYILLSLFFLFLTGLSFYKRPLFSSNGLIIFLISLPVILLCYKFSYTREDQHMYLIFSLTIMSYLFWWLLLTNWSARIILMICGISCSYFLYANQVRVGYPVIPLSQSLGFANFYREILNGAEYKAELIAQSEKYFARLDLPLEQLLPVDHHSFDIYPYNLAIIPAKNLFWQPRPVMQSYTSYTPYLDNLNAAYFNRNAGAEYIIWHNADKLSELDHRYLLNSEPNTSFAILNYYKPIIAYKAYVILKKQTRAAFSAFTLFDQQQTHWNQWLAVPKNNYALVRAKIYLRQNIWQKLINFFYAPAITIDYLLSNHTILSYPLIVATAKNGIWINPLRQSLSNALTAINLSDYPNVPGQQINYQLDKPAFQNGFLLLSGWALAKDFNPQRTQVGLILAKEKQGFIFASEPEIRPELILRFPALLASPMYSGFTAKLNLANVPNGEYQLYFKVFSQKDSAIIVGPLLTFTIGNKEKQRSETVTAIRLRQDKSVYSNDIRIEWLGANHSKNHLSD